MKRNQVKVGMDVRVSDSPSAQIYRVVNVLYNEFAAELEYDVDGEMVSGGTIDVCYLKKA